MQVCIAEKPSVGKEIARVLGANEQHDGYYAGNGYCVTWSFGHLCELKEPHDYDPVLKSWRFECLPIIPPKFGIKLKADGGIAKQFKTICYLFSQADAIINCGDAGQEGELIQRWIMSLASVHCPVYRLWISSLTEEAISQGFANLRPASEFDNLYAAGSARAVGDWLLGMNATRAYTLRYGGKGMVLSIGRVQTPTLGLIVQRYNEIQNFKPEKFWELKTIYRDTTFSATKGRFSSIEEGLKALEEVKSQPFVIDDVKSKKGKEAPPALFDLTSLQVECNNKFALSADETLRIAQFLYENKFTTYPRVDTRFLTDDIYDKVPSILQGLTPYANFCAPLLGGKKLPKSSKVFNNVKVTDHHAIIPTGVPPIPSMSLNEKRVYDLIARRFIANFYPDSIIQQTTVLGHSGKVPFKATGKVIEDPGWRVVYGNKYDAQSQDPNQDDNANKVMPQFTVGEQGDHKPQLQEKQTQPPKPYTEATLLRAMETAGKLVDDSEMRERMKENGIGRPSTRAAIIETLLRRRYIVKERKNLQPTLVGLQLINTIKTKILTSVELTGQWECKLRQIEQGNFSTKQFISEMSAMVYEVVGAVCNDTSATRFAPLQAEASSAAKGSRRKSAAQNAASNGSQNAQNDPNGAPKTSGSQSSAAEAQAPSLLCPKCGRPFVKGRAAWGCSGYAQGCKIVVPFEVMGKKLTPNQLSSLLTKGETPAMKGIVVNGNKCDGKIAFDPNFDLIFREKEPAKEAKPKVDISELRCPLCGAQVVQGRTAWGCMGYKTGCTFKVPFVFFTKKLTLTHLSVLIAKRKTGVMDGFATEAGVKVRGSMVLNDQGQVVLMPEQ